jgi:hypothetical protein
MELVPTLRTEVGMLWYGSEPRSRVITSGETPGGWTLLESTEYQRLSHQQNPGLIFWIFVSRKVVFSTSFMSLSHPRDLS